MSPARLMDTRHGLGGSPRVGAGREVVVQVAGTSGIPSDARAAVLNIVAVDPSGPGYITTYPCSRERPTTSTVNYATGQNVANNTIAALSPSGQLCIWTYDETDVIVDVTGWLGSAGDSKFTSAGPVRVTDTRSGIGGTRLAAGDTLEVDFSRVVPTGSSAVALNVTATGASASAYLTVYPCGQRLPETSTVNYVAGEDRPNNTIVGLGNGRVCIYSYAATDVLVDLVGDLGPTGLSYKPTAPVRVLDTRSGAPVPAGVSLAYNTIAPALETDVAEAAFVNVTAVDHVVPGYVTTFDCVVRRETSTVNQRVGQVSANGAIVPLQPNGDTCAWMYGGGHLVVDLNGWWVH